MYAHTLTQYQSLLLALSLSQSLQQVPCFLNPSSIFPYLRKACIVIIEEDCSPLHHFPQIWSFSQHLFREHLPHASHHAACQKYCSEHRRWPWVFGLVGTYRSFLESPDTFSIHFLTSCLCVKGGKKRQKSIVPEFKVAYQQHIWSAGNEGTIQ